MMKKHIFKESLFQRLSIDDLYFESLVPSVHDEKTYYQIIIFSAFIYGLSLFFIIRCDGRQMVEGAPGVPDQLSYTAEVSNCCTILPCYLGAINAMPDQLSYTGGGVYLL